MNVEAYAVTVQDLRHEIEGDAERLELHGHRRCGAAAARLRDRHGELAAGEKTSLVAVQGHKVRLGQDLQDGISAQGSEEDLEIRPVKYAKDRCGGGIDVRRGRNA